MILSLEAVFFSLLLYYMVDFHSKTTTMYNDADDEACNFPLAAGNTAGKEILASLLTFF